MSNVRCPMCGNENPAEAEFCQNCNARLRPVSNAPEPKPQEGDALDWLRGLSGEDSSPQGEGEKAEAASQPAAEEGAAAEGEMPDWLANIRQRSKEEPDALSPIGRKPNPEDIQPIETGDWLQGLRSEEPAAEAGAVPQGGADATPQWGADATPPAANTPEQPEEDDNEAWLSNFSSRLNAPPPAAGEQPEPAGAEPAQPMDLPDWLKEIGGFEALEGDLAGSQEAAAPETPAQGPKIPYKNASEPEILPANEVPTWLMDAAQSGPLAEMKEEPAAGAAPQPPSATPQPATEAGEETPDWVRAFAETPAGKAMAEEKPGAEAPLEPAAQAESLAPAEVPDWLKSLEQPAETPGEPVGQASSLSSEEPIAPEGQASSLPSNEVPDWLKGLEQPAETPGEPVGQASSLSAEEPPAPQGQAGSLPNNEVPDWLKGLEQPAETPAEPVGQASSLSAEEPAAPAGIPGAEAPDWLKAFAEGPLTPPEEPAPAAAGSALPSDMVPDWMKDFSAPSAAFTSEPEPEPGAQPAAGSSDWLKEFAAASQPEAGPEKPAEAEALPAEEIPDWLRPIASEAEPAGEAAAALPSVSPFSEETPQWIQQGELPAEQAPGRLVDRSAEQLAGGAHPFAGDEIPEWLAKQGEEEAAATHAAGEAAPEALEQAQLPAWLQAMRPLESAVPGTATGPDDQRVEKSGPLAGMRGVLPGEDLVAQYHKPPVYTSKLRISDRQQAHAAMLEGLLGSESTAQEIPPEPTQAPQYLVRLATAVALIAILLVVLLSGLKPLLPSALSAVDPQVAAINRMVNLLAPNAPVLVAVDYEAGLQGEMRTAALPVIRHLMQRQARLVLVSTNPVGPLLAENLINDAISTKVPFKTDQKANLGYLLGGSTALSQLAAPASSANPRPLAESLPITWVSEGNGWNQPALQGINQVTDFKQIVLITDNPDTGRAWIEQVLTQTGNKVPTIIVSSAQAAPLLRPYLASGQVAALLSGLAGGAAYEQIRQDPGSGTSYWNAYQAGILAAVLFILMGGVVSLISNLARRKVPSKA